ncbi:hypothetical protein D9757_007636 [Collybiopsis confluens]|uniref:Uncharacterized protein n=1 Tax=Collybiopsis confluens TaxID=2823264 RepID=A0A8H5M3I1_9AGAR|nr:hypothetical protein D9757_007636 [Collybiopsis confluens]
MNPEDQQIIVQYGTTYYQESIPMIVTILTYGIFILATLIAVRAIVSKSLTRSRILLLACLIAIGIGFTWDVFYFAMSNLILIKYGLVQVVRGPEGLELAGVIADKKELPLLYMSSWAGVIAASRIFLFEWDGTLLIG